MSLYELKWCCMWLTLTSDPLVDENLWDHLKNKKQTGNPMPIKWSLEWSQNHMVRKATSAMGIS